MSQNARTAAYTFRKYAAEMIEFYEAADTDESRDAALNALRMGREDLAERLVDLLAEEEDRQANIKAEKARLTEVAKRSTEKIEWARRTLSSLAAGQPIRLATKTVIHTKGRQRLAVADTFSPRALAGVRDDLIKVKTEVKLKAKEALEALEGGAEIKGLSIETGPASVQIRDA